MMKKLIMALFLVGFGCAFITQNASAATTINYNNIIADNVFDNSSSMSAAQIDSFLNGFPSSCLSTNNGFSAPDVIGYNSTDGFKYGSNVSAGTVIAHASQAYGLNPQVLLATLQKEQSLVTGAAGCYNEPNPAWPYSSTPANGKTFTCSINGSNTTCTYACTHGGGCINVAVGYGCPYYCKASSEGFSKQIIRAAWQLTFDRHRSEGENNWYINKTNWDNSDDLQWCYSGHQVAGGPYYLCPDQNSHADDPYVTHSGKYSICRSDGSGCIVVTIQNGPTAALYNYTPFLNGQESFFNNFTQWFGSTSYVVGGAIGTKYNSLGGADGILGNPLMNEHCGLVQSGCYQNFEGGTIYWTSGTGAYVIRGAVRSEYAHLKYENGFLGYATSDEITLADGGVYQQFQRGRIYWSSSTGARGIHGGILSRYLMIGADTNIIGVPTSDEITLADGGVYQQFQRGRIYWTPLSSAWDVHGGIQSRYLSLNANSGFLGYPTSGENTISGGVYQRFQHGRIYWTTTSGALNIHGSIHNRYVALGAQNGDLGLPTSEETSIDGGVYQQFQNGRIYWSSSTNAWSVQGNIEDYYLSIGDISSFLGYPTSGENTITGGTYQQFQGGQIYWISGSGITVVHGGIQSRYLALGGADSNLGVPTSNEISIDGGVYQQFQNGRIYWTSSVGAWDVHGGIQSHYLTLNGNTGFLGYPTSGEIAITGGIYQQFQNGRIYWSSSTNAWSVHGGIQSKYLSLGGEKSRLKFPTSEESSSPDGSVNQNFQGGIIHWKDDNTTVSYN